MTEESEKGKEGEVVYDGDTFGAREFRGDMKDVSATGNTAFLVDYTLTIGETYEQSWLDQVAEAVKEGDLTYRKGEDTVMFLRSTI